VRANERTDGRVAQYFSLYSWLLSTIVNQGMTIKEPHGTPSSQKRRVSSFFRQRTRETRWYQGRRKINRTSWLFTDFLFHSLRSFSPYLIPHPHSPKVLHILWGSVLSPLAGFALARTLFRAAGIGKADEILGGNPTHVHVSVGARETTVLSPHLHTWF